MKNLPNWFKLVLFIVLPVLLGMGILFFFSQRIQQKRQVYTNLLTISKLKAGEIEEWRSDLLSQAVVIRESLFFREGIDDWIRNRQIQGKKSILTRFNSVRNNYHFMNIMLFNPSGSLILSLSNRSVSLPDATSLAVRSAYSTLEPVLSDLFIDPETGLACIDTVTPLTRENGDAIGLIVLRASLRDELFPLVQSWPVKSMTAESLLVRRDGDSVLFLNELRHRKDTALKFRIPLTQKKVPAVMAVLGITGVVGGWDYRGVPVLSAIEPVPGSDWFLVAKMDKSEAYAGLRLYSFLVLFLFIVFILAFIGITGFILQGSETAYYKNLFRVTEALRESESRYSTTLMSIGDGVITTDNAGRVGLLNPIAEKLTGWRQETARGKPLSEIFRIVNEKTRITVDNPVERVLREGMIVGLANHTLLISRDGVERPIADSGAPIRNDKDQIIGVVLVFRDQTEERKAMSALAALSSRQQAILSAIPDIIMEVDVDKNYTWANPSGLEFFGPDCVGREASYYFEGEQKTYQLVQPLFNGSEDLFYVESWQRRKDGEKRLLAWWCRNLKDVEGKVTGALSTGRDITDQRRMEDQLQQSRRMEVVGHLAGGVAHDFNNILQIILGNLELARTDAAGFPGILASLDEIRKAAKRSADLTGQLLAFARKQTVNPRVIDVNDTIESMLRMLRRLIGEDIDLAWMPGPDLWHVKMDPTQIDQVLANLTINARDAIASTGKVTIETTNIKIDREYARTHTGAAAGEYVMLAVSDNGRGIAREDLPRVFEPFFTTKASGKGTGLGLATVEGIVKQNKGFINVYSEVGLGSTFRIYLPRYADSTEVLSVTREQPESRRGSETILVVEDEPAVLEQCRLALERLGYKVLKAESPTIALNLVDNFDGTINLLLTDVIMPVMHGRELFRRLAIMRPDLKCLYMSGYTANVIAHQGILDKDVAFVQKPFEIRDLAAKIREVLES